MTEPVFWHPIGPHAGESMTEIIERKRRDIEKYGVTYWSFAGARPPRVQAWRKALNGVSDAKVYCLYSRVAVDPGEGRSAVWMSQYSENQTAWKALPSNRMVSYQKPAIASAFVVDRIELTRFTAPRPMRWLQTDTGWKDEPSPTRGTHLVEAPESEGHRLVQYVLHLRPPFVVWVR